MPGERALRRRPFPAGRAQRLPATAAARIPRQLHDVHAAQPLPLPRGRLHFTGAAHGDQRQGHADQFKGTKTWVQLGRKYFTQMF